MSSFTVVKVKGVPAAAPRFRLTWVGTPENTHSTCVDVETRRETTALVHVPTHSVKMQRLLDAVSIKLQLDQLRFDISSAFLPAGEGAEVYMHPPAEWKNICGGADDDV